MAKLLVWVSKKTINVAENVNRTIQNLNNDSQNEMRSISAVDAVTHQEDKWILMN